MPGFHAVHGGVNPQQAVAVGLANAVVGVFLGGIHFFVVFRKVGDDAFGQNAQIAGGGVVLWVGQASGVLEVRVRQAQPFGLLIHQRCKVVFVASQQFCDCAACIVARLHNHTVQQLFNSHRLVRFDKHARTFGFPGVGRHGYLLIHPNLLAVECSKGHVGCHQFGQ